MLRSEAVKKSIKTEGGYLNKAEKDRKTIRTALRGCKLIRKELTQKLKEIKKAMKTAIGAEAHELHLKRVYYRDQLEELMWSHISGKENLKQCSKYITEQRTYVQALDNAYESARAIEATDPQTAA